jgi:hypothetical protein
MLLIYSLKSNSQEKKNDLSEFKLFGSVKSIKESNFSQDYKTGLMKKDTETISFEYRLFDQLGNVIEEKQNNLFFKYTTKKKYDINGKLIEEKQLYDDSSLSRVYIYKYDENGNSIETIVYNTNGSLYGKIKYNYNDRKNLVEEAFYYADGGLTKIQYKYDDKNNRIEQVSYNIKGYLSMMIQFDNRGNRIETRFYKDNGILDSKSLYKYDDRGNCVEETKVNLQDSSKSSRSINKYDSRGNDTLSIHYTTDDEYDRVIISRSQYKFDLQGNWVERINFISGRINGITTRKIEYYK